tara:strand:- start:2188 stop:2478 length:291 start_codon:yes stop_codon:yes gene_type:complete
MRESVIEKYLVSKVKAAGGVALKWSAPGNNGVPDRIIFLPDTFLTRLVFVELKAPGKLPTKLQLAVHKKLLTYDQSVVVVDSKQEVDRLLGELVCP